MFYIFEAELENIDVRTDRSKTILYGVLRFPFGDWNTRNVDL